MKTNDFYSINDQLTALFQQFDVPSSDETDNILDTVTHMVADAIEVAAGVKAPLDPEAKAEAVIAANYADEDGGRSSEEILQELLDSRALDASDVIAMLTAAAGTYPTLAGPNTQAAEAAVNLDEPLEIIAIADAQDGMEYPLYVVPPANLPGDHADQIITQVIDKITAAGSDDEDHCPDYTDDDILSALKEYGFRPVQMDVAQSTW